MKLGKTLKGVIGTVAPTIASAIGGPFGSMAANFALEKLGITSGNDPVSQLDVVMKTATPEQLLLLKNADNDFQVKMEELGIRREELSVRNTESARQMAIATGIWPQIILSVIYTVGYFIMMYYFVTGQVTIADGVRSEFNMVLGVLTAAQVQILNFWFGSSSGSKEKTKLAGA